MQKDIKIDKNFSIEATTYASQANAILGIRDSGKTYTATLIAEQLLECGIPFIAFDPVGVWKYLRKGSGTFKGYPIIVAGGDDSCDILLTPENAVNIVRAAMKTNASLVIDLYSPSLAIKSSWIKIVKDCIHALMYENKSYNLRHVFLEEAAEFIPQVVRSQHAQVYSEIERLARMGRNAKVGMTLIKQRAEEVNKAILEICNLSLLHKQVGKNSLTSISKWMEITGIKDAKHFLNEIPKLEKGNCIAVSSALAIRVQVLKKKTYHPSPQVDSQNKVKFSFLKNSNGVFSILSKMNELLLPTEAAKKINEQKVAGKLLTAKKDSSLQDELKFYKMQLLNQSKEIEKIRESFIKVIHVYNSLSEDIKRNLHEMYNLKDRMQKIVKDEKPALIQNEKTAFQPTIAETTNILREANSKLKNEKSGVKRILKAAAMYEGKPVPLTIIGALAGLSHTSGTFGVYYRELKRSNLIEDREVILENKKAKGIAATHLGLAEAGEVDQMPRSPEDIVELWCNLLGRNGGMANILKSLFSIYPKNIDASELGSRVNMSSSSGTFGVYTRKLRKLNLIVLENGYYKCSPELFNGLD